MDTSPDRPSSENQPENQPLEVNTPEIPAESVITQSTSTPHARNLLRFVYTNNPFYTLSAAMVFWGLRRSFTTGGATFEIWALVVSLAGYTLLLAGTAWLLIRRGSVWQDVRSLLLLVALMFLAISVTFDDALARNWQQGAMFFVGGLLFAIGVSEFLLRALPIRLPWLYRGPFYLMLALFFLYPVALGPWLNDPSSPTLQWALFGFSSVAGLVFLTLLPAIRRGPNYVKNNGTPWKWPLFPWTLFVLLGLGVGLRSYYLCVSLHFVGGTSSIFAPYFVTPFLWAVAILLLEIGLVAANRLTQRIAMLMPLALLGLGVTEPRPDLVYQQFLDLWVHSVGSPLFLTLHAAIAFYLLAALRRVGGARDLLIVSIAGLTLVGPRTLNAAGLTEQQGVPLIVAAAAMLWLSITRRESWRALVAVGCLLVAAHIEVQAPWFIAWERLILWNALLAAVLLIGVVYRDPFSEFLRFVGGVMMVFFCTQLAWRPEKLFGHAPIELLMIYPLVLATIAAGYGYFLRERFFYVVAVITVFSDWRLYLFLRQHVVGLDEITVGLLFFSLALKISLDKANKSRRAIAGQEGS